MNIIAHRGFWDDSCPKNSMKAFEKALDSGFGIETDIRDDRGTIVIAHDMPKGEEVYFSDLLKLLDKKDLTLAINIKSDGLSTELKRLIEDHQNSNYFTFDMSFPESRKYLKEKLRPFISISEYQLKSPATNQYSGIWLDSFDSEWADSNFIRSLSLSGDNLPICIVSPELHGRNHLSFWNYLKSNNIHKIKNIAICTDFPHDANIFFNEVIQ